MFVFDIFIDIESTHDFHIYFQIFNILSENRILVMIGVPTQYNLVVLYSLVS